MREEIMAVFVCKYCAKTTSRALSGFCSRSPNKNHELIVEQSEYTCKYCGRISTKPFSGPCKTSPHKNHEMTG
jgi:DNA-directed RNA polymerase subunit RPC12/RpoP